jgi:DNA helicase-2/ATP-dependent DNA helicase PcrA
LGELYLIDSDSSRVKVLHSILMGFKFYLKGYFKDARKEVIMPLKIKADKLISKLELSSIAIEIIDDLKKEETMQKNLFNYYMTLLDNLYGRFKFRIGSKITNTCKAKSFYESISIADLLKYIKVDTKSEDTIRTIHSAKGTEFDNTLVYFEKIQDFKKYVFDCKNYLNSDEDDARIYYVGFSRAKRNLFISIPKIDEDVISGINKLNIEYFDCSK